MVGGIRPSAGVVLPLLPPALLHYTINRRKLQAVRQKICAKKVKMLGGVPCAALVRPAAVVPEGGACPLCRPPTLPLAFDFAPIPPTPFPSGEGGRPRLFHARGFAPCIPATEPARHRLDLPLWKTQWGGLPRRCRRGGRQRYPAGGLPGWSPAYPAFSLLSCPLSPRPPSPVGKGETKVISCTGLRPLHPRD